MPSNDRTRMFHLLGELVRRDFRMRFTGSALGVAWAVLQPLSFVFLYWFVFTIILPPSGQASQGDYALFLISGLLPFLGFQEGIIRATPSIVDNGQLVRRLTFRSEILAVVPNVSAILFELIGLGCLLVYIITLGMPLRGLWVLPVAIGLQLAMQTGIAWFLATVHVFFRDVMQVIGLALTFALFLSPILYSAKGPWEKFLRWNPLTPLLGLFRSALLGAPLPDAMSFVFLLTVTATLFFGGLVFFRRAQPTLADLI